jgi:hypothetical protein
VAKKWWVWTALAGAAAVVAGGVALAVTLTQTSPTVVPFQAAIK